MFYHCFVDVLPLPYQPSTTKCRAGDVIGSFSTKAVASDFEELLVF